MANLFARMTCTEAQNISSLRQSGRLSNLKTKNSVRILIGSTKCRTAQILDKEDQETDNLVANIEALSLGDAVKIQTDT